MAEVYFYHLTRSPLDAALRALLEKARAAGWRVAVRGTTEAFLDHLDTALWRGPDEGFLPHGRAGGPHDAAQPILLTTATAAANAPDCLVSVEGAAIAPAEVAALARVLVLFDGTDPGSVETARDQWRSLTAAGLGAVYWSEESGSWQKKREVAAKG